MGSVLGGKLGQIDGHILPVTVPAQEPQQNQNERPDRNVRRINGNRIHFADLARMAFPEKTEANLAFFGRVDVRTARRWLAPDDKNEPPADVLGIVLSEIMRRFHQRG